MKASTRKLINIIMAVLVSVGAWMFVVYNYYPMTNVRYSDVTLKFYGEDNLAERGLAVSEVGNESIYVTLNQKRIDVNRFSSGDIDAALDVSECVAGDNSVVPIVSGPKDTTVANYDKKGINVKVDRTDSKYMDIDVIYGGEAAENEVPIASDLGMTQAQVICAASRLSEVDKVAAVLDYDEVGDKTKSFTAKLAAIDKEGNQMAHVTIYPDEISLDAMRGVKKDVSLNVVVKNSAKDDYERTYTAPDKISVLVPRVSASEISSIDAYEIDISYRYEDEEIPIEIIWPEGVYLSPEAEEPVVKLKVVKNEKTEDAKSESTSESTSDS